ncbi:hypothetical protein HDU67_007744 [Dinochytrium kinnereticum]|nr:hypothetical protein HDU67_007744 [Dinochytrium kinnereticum]
MAWGFNDIPSLAGKVMIVTGGNTGLGKLDALHPLCPLTNGLPYRTGDLPIIASRSEAKSLPVIADLKKETGNDNVEFIALNLLSLKSVEAFAKTFINRGLPLHALILNAGIMACPFTLSEDGIESQFATNHVAELNARLQARGINNIYANAVHPGVIRTELVRHQQEKIPSFIFSIYYSLGPLTGVISQDQGASTQLYLATSPEIEEKAIRGEFFIPVAKLSKPVITQGTDMDLAKRLWDFTDALVKEKLGN